MSIVALLVLIAGGLLIAAVLTFRGAESTADRRRGVLLGAMALLGGIVAANPSSLAALHVRLILAEGDSGHLKDMPDLVAQLGPRSAIEIVEVHDDGTVWRSQDCLRPGELGRGVRLSAVHALADAIASRRCSSLFGSTVAAVLPSSRLSSAVNASIPTNASGVLASALLERDIPLTLLADDSSSARSHWVVTRPYLAGPVDPGTNPLPRVNAYGYEIRPDVPASTKTTVTIEHGDSTHRYVRTDIPVHRWDAASQIVGPIPLSVGTDGPFGDGLHWFRDGSVPDQTWFPVVAGRLRIFIDAPPKGWDPKAARWSSLPGDKPDSSPTFAELIANSSTWHRSDVFQVASSFVDADAAVTASARDTSKFLAEGGRSVTVALSCPKPTRYGLTLISLDHGRASLGEAGLLQRAFIDGIGVAAGAISAAPSNRVFQIPIGANEKNNHLQWATSGCGNDALFDARARNLDPILVRGKGDWAQLIRFTPALVDGACSAYASSAARSGDGAASATARDLLPSSFLVRASVLEAYEPELVGNTRLDGVTVVFLGANIPVWGADLAMPASSDLRLLSPEAKALKPAVSWTGDAAIRALLGRGAHVIVVPVSVGRMLSDAMAKEAGRPELSGDRLMQFCSALKRREASVECLPLIETRDDAKRQAKTVMERIQVGSPSLHVGGRQVRDQRFASDVRIYDDACAGAKLLDGTTSGRGTGVTTQFDLFSPLNWLADADGVGARYSAMASDGGAPVGLGPQVLSDVWFGHARPFGNRLTLGSLSARLSEGGELELTRPSTIQLRVLREGMEPLAVGASVLRGTSLVQGSVPMEAAQSGASLELARSGVGVYEKIALSTPPIGSVKTQKQISWRELARKSRGFVMSGGTLADYHRPEWVPWVLLCLGATVLGVFVSPLASSWPIVTWLPAWWRRTLTIDSAQTPLSLSERAQMEEAGRAAGRIVARRTAGEPEGVRQFASGDSPNAIVALDLASFTAAWRSQGMPRLVARARTRRSQQIPSVVVALDSSVLGGGLEHEFIRGRYWLLATAVAQVCLAAGAAVRIAATDDPDAALEIAGALDAAAILRAIDSFSNASGAVDSEALSSSALCVLVSPVSTDRLGLYGTLLADVRSQGVHCVILHVSMKAFQLPGAYFNVRRGARGIVNRQSAHKRSHSEDHDRLISSYFDGIGIPCVSFYSRRTSMSRVLDALSDELRTPV